MNKIDILHKDIIAIRHEIRSNIIDLLTDAIELNVTEIRIAYYRSHQSDLEQSIISLHLNKLKRCNILHMRKQGKFHYYKLNSEKLESIHTAIENY